MGTVYGDHNAQASLRDTGATFCRQRAMRPQRKNADPTKVANQEIHKQPANQRRKNELTKNQNRRRKNLLGVVGEGWVTLEASSSKCGQILHS
eukprot:6145322-Amphidinium_carterae.2